MEVVEDGFDGPLPEDLHAVHISIHSVLGARWNPMSAEQLCLPGSIASGTVGFACVKALCCRF